MSVTMSSGQRPPPSPASPAHRAPNNGPSPHLDAFAPTTLAFIAVAVLASLVAGVVFGPWGAYCAAVLGVFGVLVVRRRAEERAWERELEVAFRVSERNDSAMRRLL